MPTPIVLYHGAHKWSGPPRLMPAGKGRSDFGSGLNLTNAVSEAQKYAKGGGVLMRFEISPDLVFLEDVKVPKEAARAFVREFVRRNKKLVLADFDGLYRGEEIPAHAVENLIQYHGALTGETGPALARFFVAHGIDASQIDRGGRDQIILYNLDKILSYERVAPTGAKDAPRLRDRKENPLGRKARTATLFSGGGTIEAGLEGLIEPVLAIEYSKPIAAHYARVWGDHILSLDVREADFDRLREERGPIDYLHASPVCKNFSRAQACSLGGERELDIDTAEATARALRAFRPVVFSLENVPRYRNSQALGIITSALDDLGYTYDLADYEASQYGGATRRKRMLLRAVRGGELPPRPEKAPAASWYALVEDLLEELPQADVPAWLARRLARYQIDLKNVEEPLIVAGGSVDKNVVPFARSGEPVFTIKATPKEKHRIALPGGRVLGATPRVLARLSGLPDSYPLPEHRMTAVTVVGNGVPTQLSRAVLGPLLLSQAERFSGDSL